MRFALATVALFISSAYAATVQLDDGRIIDGEVWRQTPEVIVLNAYDGNAYEIQRMNITWFSSDTVAHAILREPIMVAYGEATALNCAVEPLAEPVMTAPAEPRRTAPIFTAPANPQPDAFDARQSSAPPISTKGEEIPIPTSFSAPLVVPPPDFPQPATEAQANALREAIPHLSDAAEPADRALAEETIRSAGPAGLTVLFKSGIYNPIPSVRQRSVSLLAALGGRGALKQMIEAFYSGAYPTIPPYQVSYMENLASQISRMTGKDFYFYARRSARAPEVANAMLAWWDQNWHNLPPQLGEPKLDNTRADYEALLREVRRLDLVHRDFPGANLPTEAVSPPLTPTPAEQQFLNSVPVIPRDSINSTGPRVAADQEPVVEKNPSPARDEPGMLRQQNYTQRLNELESR